jgi:putative glutathione S-transferase
MLNSEFNDFATNPELDLYPESARAKIDETNEWVYDNLNNGVYKAGFATAQTECNFDFSFLKGANKLR